MAGASRPFLDHLALGAHDMDAVAERFSRDLGGREVARFREPSWDGLQLAFAGGIRLEVLQPLDDPRDDFLQRFLEHTGPGPHHVTFKVPDIEATLRELAAMNVEPVKVDLSDPNWKEAFLHPKLGLGTVVQLAEVGGPWAAEQEPAPLAPGGVAAAFLGAQVRGDVDVARRILGELLQGDARELPDGAVAFSWDRGGTLLVQPAGDAQPGVAALVFRGADESIWPDEEPVFDGPARVVRLGPHEDWPNQAVR
ncbi:MAG: VOC family protein [Candidatus Dormibacteraeota bacterium]|nr:VOC family protein [Candidatus Dormibacteraeota bacterium]